MFSGPWSFLLFFEDLVDPSEDHKVVHSLQDMIFLALCGALANCDHWTEIEMYARSNLTFLKKYISLKNGVPSHDTFSRVFTRLDPAGWLGSDCR